MALPSTFAFGVPAVPGYHPPFKSTSSGWFYGVGSFETGANAFLEVRRSVSPDTTWSRQDSGNAPTSDDLDVYEFISAVQDGDVIHIASYQDGGAVSEYRYHQFNMADETWSVVDQTIEAPANLPTFPWISIAVRSNGDVVVVYAGSTDTVMGGAKERADYNVRTTGTWGGPVALGVAAGDVHDGNPNCVLGTNDFVHCVWQHTANTTDPPTAWTDTIGSSIDPADDSLSANDASDADTGGALLGFPNVVSYDDDSVTDTGWKFPGTAADNDARSIPGANSLWANESNILADDGSVASWAVGPTPPDVSYALSATNFDFSSIPTGAVIVGVEVRVGDHQQVGGSGLSWTFLQLILADNSDGTENRNASLTAPSGSLVTDDVGGASDSWSETLRAADVQNSNFGFYVSQTGTDADDDFDVDFMQMKIYWVVRRIIQSGFIADGTSLETAQATED